MYSAETEMVQFSRLLVHHLAEHVKTFCSRVMLNQPAVTPAEHAPVCQIRLHGTDDGPRRLDRVVGATHELKGSYRHVLQRESSFDGSGLY